MFFWNNIVSLFTGGNYLYFFKFTFSPISDFFEMTSVGKGKREKTTNN